mmetsp:Transcript_72950/g.120824  ORF Transcript_72950/g.120824 Transcript_72950/m.120824 type:complete len:80 (+) Transcript_72950:151-390(+)
MSACVIRTPDLQQELGHPSGRMSSENEKNLGFHCCFYLLEESAWAAPAAWKSLNLAGSINQPVRSKIPLNVTALRSCRL